MKIRPVILCGGAGTRLWPKQKKHQAKQFIDFGGWSLIQKTLQRISHGISSIENELMFAGHSAYRFASDPFYKNGFVPKVKELVDRISRGL